ncbi:MAG TPA: hypothetical protein PLL56_13795 [Verrucomicrobiota bacterium]|jgi:hypothetical protein|nr:MAG: hypothetical protein BWX68_02652 [Verrucomicrobia bacterium ADurb.Bin063]HNW08768.1 hypothetical protein [Verrucomicrobiota bacterium]HOX63931.1 hypothetical protein [Verrucomicrobiota bacterium]HPW82501.1 hypothetical protein [Verrucomicrobiota bacterium]
MSLLDQMRAERETNTAKAEARLGRFLGPGSGPTTQNVHHGGRMASANKNQKLSHKVNNCCQPATTDENQKLSQNRHNGAQPETTTHATGLPQNLQSRDGKRLASLLDQYRRGVWMEPATEQAVELTLAVGVSLRTAQRHVKRGTLPAQERRMGADGKQHPLSNGARVRSKTERELALARQALARAARAAATDGIQAPERELLKQIQVMVAEMKKRRPSQLR